jgi:hypothetical protein
VEWIPRTENERADFISRIVDFDDWGISEDLFLYGTFFTAVSSFHVKHSNFSDHIPWAILSGFSTICPPYPVELASLWTIVLQETSVVNLRTLMSLKLFFQKEICSILSLDKVIKLFHVSADKMSILCD